MERARETSRNLALIAERDIERNLELYALSLQAVVDGVRDPEVMALPPRLRAQVLFDRATTARDLGAILVLDASGNIIIDSASEVARTGNFADRRYFTVQRDNPNAGLRGVAATRDHHRLADGRVCSRLRRTFIPSGRAVAPPDAGRIGT
ncbi:hypothetical protein PTKU64_80750 [Paraburkholderia terrae]|uniref:Uncharacterized protein n=1 Tax=Paraburkholderia terrae TaxID=311230 RepID=A0ABM7U047_9BURK|nr:hypothetical protein PTKU64_80750 [Paraburkholderia terrae]